MQTKQQAIIIGAGPAGLTAAYELATRAHDIQPIIFESSGFIGGLAKTIVYKGNRMDMGGHRFFSKSDRVMQWWNTILPTQGIEGNEQTIHLGYHNKTRPLALFPKGPNPSETDTVMLVRKRRSRIYFLGKFFDYPIALNP